MSEHRETSEVWNEFSGQIRSYLVDKVKQKDDADDLLQEIFIKIHNNLSELRDENKLAPWIYQIVRNSLIDYYRKLRAETSELNEETIAAESSEANDDIYSACVSGCLKVFIERLPEKYREPLVMSEIKGLKQKDIARDMNLSYSGLKSRVQRGRGMLKDMFVECACFIHDDSGKPVGGFLGSEDCRICNPGTN